MAAGTRLRGVVRSATASQVLVLLDSGLVGTVCPADVDEIVSSAELPARFAEGEVVEGTVLGAAANGRWAQLSLSELLPGAARVRCEVTQEGADHAFLRCSGNREGLLYATDAASPAEWRSFPLAAFAKGRVFEAAVVREIPARADCSAKLVVALRRDLERVRSFALTEGALVHGFVARVQEKKVVLRLNDDCLRSVPPRFAFDDPAAPTPLQPGVLVAARVLRTKSGQLVLSMLVGAEPAAQR